MDRFESLFFKGFFIYLNSINQQNLNCCLVHGKAINKEYYSLTITALTAAQTELSKWTKFCVTLGSYNKDPKKHEPPRRRPSKEFAAALDFAISHTVQILRHVQDPLVPSTNRRCE